MADDKKFATTANEAFRSHNFDTAVNLYTQAIKLNPAEWKHYSNRSAALLANGAGKRALRDAEKCIEIDRTRSTGYMRQGSALVGLGRFAEAVAAFMAGLALDAASQPLKDALAEARARHQRNLLSDFSALESAEQHGAAGNDEEEDEADREEARLKAEMLAFFSEVGDASTRDPTKVGLRVVDDEVVEKSTAEEQIARLLQKNFFWKNLNPFKVLLLPPNATEEDIKQRYHKLSALVHPDKVADPRARDAFIEVKNAYQTLQNDLKRENIVKLMKGARKTVEAKRAKLVAKGMDQSQLEPLDFAVEQATMTIFAQAEQRRRLAKKNEVVYTRRERDQELAERKKRIAAQKFNEAWDESRDNRVDNWRDFADLGGTKKKRRMGFEVRAPEVIAETAKDSKGASEHLVAKNESYKKKWR